MLRKRTGLSWSCRNIGPVLFDVKTNLIAFVHHDEMEDDDPSLISSKHVTHTNQLRTILASMRC